MARDGGASSRQKRRVHDAITVRDVASASTIVGFTHLERTRAALCRLDRDLTAVPSSVNGIASRRVRTISFPTFTGTGDESALTPLL